MKSFLLVTLTIITILFSGCTDNGEKSEYDLEPIDTDENITEKTSEGETDSDKSANSSPEYGGTLKLSMRVPKSLNPLINEDITVDKILKIMFEPLFKKDKTGKIIPNIAESYSFLNDTLTIKIKDGLKWHNGGAITANDVIFSLNIIKAQGDKSLYKDALINVSSYSNIGNTITIKLTKPFYYSIYNLCFPVISSDYYNGKTNLDSDVNMRPLGSGSFKFSSYQLAHELLLEKCEGINGSPYIDKISALITDSRETDLYAFEQSVTGAIQSDVSEWGKFSAGKEINITEYDTNDFEFLGFNFKNPQLSGLNLRQAISLAVPLDELTENVYLNHGVKSHLPINPHMWYYSKDITPPDYNLEAAAEIIENSGYTKDKLKFSILVNSENKSRCEAASIIADRLNQIGFDVTVNKQNFDAYQNLLKTDNFDMFIGGVRLSKLGELKPFLSSASITAGINLCNYSNTQVDALLDKLETVGNDEDFRLTQDELQKFIDREIPCVGICFKYSAVLTDKNINGFKNPTADNIYNDIQKWYINKH